MASISEKKSQTDYEIIGDTQGIMIPQPLKATVFKPLIPATLNAGTNYYLSPDQILLNDLGIDPGGFIPVKSGDSFIIEYPQVQFTAPGAPMASWFVDFTESDKATLVETLSPWTDTYAGNVVPATTHARALRDGFMRFRIQMNTAATDAKLGTGSGERATRIYVTRIDQLVPYMIANKGALVSDNAIGKVKIDDDGTMSISGELGTGTNGSKVSINRPDKWTPGIEYDFGDGLYGIRKQGTITQGVLEANLISIVDNIGTAKLISSGGSVDRGDGICPAANGSLLSFRSGIFYQTPGIGMYSVSDWARTNAPYDVWVTYSK